MSSDKLSKKAREAAEHYDSSYSEQAWEKMKKLLDEKMPEGTAYPIPSKRRFAEKWPFLLAGILCVVSIIIIQFHRWEQNFPEPSNSSSITTKAIPNSTEKGNILAQRGKVTGRHREESDSKSVGHARAQDITSDTISIKQKLQESMLADLPIQKKNSGNKSVINGNSSGDLKNNGITRRKQPFLLPYSSADINLKLSENQSSRQYDTAVFLARGSAPFMHFYFSSIPFSSHVLPGALDSLTTRPTNSLTATLPRNLADHLKGKKTFGQHISISFSAGTEVSNIRFQRFGKMAMIYGAGLGYSINDHWQIRTGYFITDKKYDALPADYNPPPAFWTYYPHLQDIHANCLISEVPVLISYNFKPKKKLQWFVSAGLSSYFMKRETYDYRSSGYAGIYTKSYTIKNENSHYLSSFRISGGFTRELSDKFSISTEPYINTPLSGVGYGKIKLSGVGLLISVNLKPLAKK